MPRHTFQDNRFHSHYRETARLDRGKSFLELTAISITRSILRSLYLSPRIIVQRYFYRAINFIRRKR